MRPGLPQFWRPAAEKSQMAKLPRVRLRGTLSRRVLLITIPALLCLFLFSQLADVRSTTVSNANAVKRSMPDETQTVLDFNSTLSEEEETAPANIDPEQAEEARNRWRPQVPLKPRLYDSREVFSRSTRDRKYFPVHFGGTSAYNPNIIPHPKLHDMWIVVAQHEQASETIKTSQQLTCTAGFLNDVLLCTEEPTVLPVERSVPGRCEGEFSYFNFRNGPRDARMFYGPFAPYLVYGSQSLYTCLGIWLNDARMLLPEFKVERHVLVDVFKKSTELQRPLPWKPIEKNFFMFWDSTGKAYVHYDLWPMRSFAQLDADGSVVGSDLAPAAEEKDLVCMAKYMPKLESNLESIHQATNALTITMCRRKDPGCVPTDDNTFIMHIFHHKTYYNFHGIYEPYVILFKRNAPFDIHAISTRPFWIHGRGPLTAQTGSVQFLGRENWIPEGHTEMFYITSMSWMAHGQKYHGYMDDKLLISFGIEDTRSAAIDVLAADLLQDLGVC
jgi:hypothetical protein